MLEINAEKRPLRINGAIIHRTSRWIVSYRKPTAWSWWLFHILMLCSKSFSGRCSSPVLDKLATHLHTCHQKFSCKQATPWLQVLIWRNVCWKSNRSFLFYGGIMKCHVHILILRLPCTARISLPLLALRIRAAKLIFLSMIKNGNLIPRNGHCLYKNHAFC